MLSQIKPTLDTLSRAVSRATVTIVMHPELRADDAMPRHAVTPEDERTASCPSPCWSRSHTAQFACRIILRAEPLRDGSIEATSAPS